MAIIPSDNEKQAKFDSIYISESWIAWPAEAGQKEKDDKWVRAPIRAEGARSGKAGLSGGLSDGGVGNFNSKRQEQSERTKKMYMHAW